MKPFLGASNLNSDHNPFCKRPGSPLQSFPTRKDFRFDPLRKETLSTKHNLYPKKKMNSLNFLPNPRYAGVLFKNNPNFRFFIAHKTTNHKLTLQ